jgi:hypothetical protein
MEKQARSTSVQLRKDLLKIEDGKAYYKNGDIVKVEDSAEAQAIVNPLRKAFKALEK